VGKGEDRRGLPFPVLDDGSEEHAPIYGLIAGLRASATELTVVLPVDCPLVTASMLLSLTEVCPDVARFPRGPLPGAYRRTALPALEWGELAIHRAISDLDVLIVDCDPALLVNVDTPAELAALEQRRPAGARSTQRAALGPVCKRRPAIPGPAR
jgi:molybdopterin-guanine dinucleotide biosynthesis protein A